MEALPWVANCPGPVYSFRLGTKRDGYPLFQKANLDRNGSISTWMDTLPHTRDLLGTSSDRVRI